MSTREDFDYLTEAQHWLFDTFPDGDVRVAERVAAIALVGLLDEVRALRDALTSTDRGRPATETSADAEQAPAEGQGAGDASGAILGDPDEALAKVVFGGYMLSPSWDEAEPDMRKAWIDVARAAREHIESEGSSSITFNLNLWAEREKAEADLADMTRQRDEWQARHAALRGAVVTDPSILRMAAADIEAQGTGFGGLPRSLPETLRRLADALDRDTERAETFRQDDEP